MERTWSTIGLLLAISVVTAAMCTATHADTIILKGGKSVSGNFYRQGSRYVIEPYHGAAFSVPVSDVTGIVLAPNPNSEKARGYQWNLVKYNISQSDNLPKIENMLRQFIAAHPQSTFLSSARKALIKYRQYQKLHLIKLGKKWISPYALTALKQDVDKKLRAAVQLYERGRLTRALKVARHATLQLPSSAHAWVVTGVVEYRLNRLPSARHDLAKALRLASDNIAALNDAAILNFKTHQQPRSLVLFGKALAIDAGNRQLLDNIYATLRRYKADRKSPLFINFRRNFKMANHAMEVRLARRGLYRLGATWVNAKIYKKAAAKLTAFQEQKQAIQSSYDSAVLAFKAVEAQIRQTNAQIVNLQNVIGNLQVQQNFLAYQTGYYDYGAQAALSMNLATLAQAQAHVTQLENQRISILAGLASIRAQARAFQKSGPGVVLDGRQEMLFPRKFAPVPKPLAMPNHLLRPHARILSSTPLGHRIRLPLRPR